MWGWISNIATLFGLAGVSLATLVDDPITKWVSFSLFVLLCVFIAVRVHYCTKKFLSLQYPKGYVPLSTSCKWTTADGDQIVYEVFRHIQIKKPYMRCLDHRFNWTGTKLPRIESALQSVSEIRQIEGEMTRGVTLKFPTTRIYNDVEIINFKMHLDDSDHKASPFLLQRVESPIRLITFQVELLHAPAKYMNSVAIVTKRSLSHGNAAVETQIDTVNFDVRTKSFYCQLLEPELGYDYKLSWQRPELSATRAKRKSGPAWQ